MNFWLGAWNELVGCDVCCDDIRRTEMHLYGGSANSKPANNYDVELVAAPSESVDNYCKGHGMLSGEYTYTHVWQPASLASVDVAQYQHATSSSPAAVTGVVRHCCRDHLYESPTFDDNGVERAGPLVFPPYYYHAAAAARQSRPTENTESRRTAVALPLSDMTSYERRHHPHQPQQQQQAGQVGQVGVQVGQVGVSDDNNLVSAGGHETAETTAAAVGVSEWYQPCRTTRYEPVICRTSSSDPDVTLRPRTENHYTWTSAFYRQLALSFHSCHCCY